MTKLAMHNNLLAVYPQILQRLQKVEGVKAAKEVGELAELLASRKDGGKAKVAPLNGAVYVVYGGDQVSDQAQKGKQIKHTLYFTFVLCQVYLPNKNSTLHEIGAILTAIQAAFAGWDAGAQYVSSPFRRVASPSIEYNDGYAFYPISFAVDVITSV